MSNLRRPTPVELDEPVADSRRSPAGVLGALEDEFSVRFSVGGY
jgi:hypothetical protein